jgi:uncharacterized protein
MLVYILGSQYPLLAQHKEKLVWYDKEKTRIHAHYFCLPHRNNIIDSLYEEYFPNGQLRSRGIYKHNKPVGVWEYFHENGNLRMKGEIKNHHNHGSWVYYHENGQKFMQGELKNGQKTGYWDVYYDNGKLKSKGEYAKGIPLGTWQYFYEDGTPKATCLFQHTKGRYKEYYKTGQLKMEGLLQDGKSDSTWNYFFENGKLKATGTERSGLKDGYWKFFNDTGLLASEGLYLNGLSYGKWRYYHENGVLSAEGTQKQGEKDGFWKLYYPTGEFKAETQFTMGEGPYKEYYESGKLKVTGYIKNGQNEGQWLYYYEDGIPEGICEFRTGAGNFVGYYPNGNIKMEGRIEDGVKTGVWKLYKPEGELAGYYKTYYEEKETVFLPIVEEDSLPKTIKPDTLVANKKTDNEGKSTTVKRKRMAKTRYFRPKINEYKALILATNPVAPLVYNQWPIYLEYLIEERMGFEFIYIFYRKPFVGNQSSLADRVLFNSGHGFEFVQKFYHKTNNLGSLYFGHGIRVRLMEYGASVLDTNAGSSKVFQYKLKQQAYEYAVIGGDRVFLGGKSDQAGWTVDFFIGLGMGTLQNNYNNGMGYFPVDEIFHDVQRKAVYFTPKLGLSLGYMF